MSAPSAGPASQARTSFAYSFPFLPRARRKALGAVYDFCRATDDIVDGEGSPAEKTARLRRWDDELDLAFAAGSAEPVLNGAAAVSKEYGIPGGLFHDLVKGVGMDITTSRYHSFGDLREYCRLVASAVGLMCLDIFGRRNPRTESYAGSLGVALQLTNIIRDVGVDARMGRIYLPLEDLRAFGCAEEEILAGRDSERFRRLMAFQAGRAEEFYAAAGGALDAADLPAMKPALVMEKIYHRTLARIRAAGYDVLRGPVRLSRAEQLAVAIRYGVLGARRAG
jgi:phytoene synthase